MVKRSLIFFLEVTIELWKHMANTDNIEQNRFAGIHSQCLNY